MVSNYHGERELALHTPKLNFQRILENAPVGVYTTNIKGVILYSNQVFLKMADCDSLDNLNAYGLLNLYRNLEDREHLLELLRKNGRVNNFEVDVVSATGQVKRVLLSAALEGDILSGIVIDITARAQAQEELKRSQRILASTLDALDGLLFVIDRDHRIILSNWKDHEFITEKEREGRPLCYKVFKHFENRCEFCPPVKTFIDGKPRIYEDRNPVDGTYKEIHVSPIFDDDRKVTMVVEYVYDITARKRAEQELKDREEHYRLLFNSGNDSLFVNGFTDEGFPGPFIEVNDVACQRLGYLPEELLRMSPIDVVSNWTPEMDLKVVEELTDKEQSVFERILISKTGTKIPVEISSHLFELDGRPVILSVIRDITERKKAEERIRESLQEKEIMLQEIHHRVKNNMQIMSSLIRLQFARSDNEEMQKLVTESQNRIRSMTLVHEILYQSKDFARINVQKYVKKLVSNLKIMHDDKMAPIDIKMNTGDFFMDINRSIPCGLIINELVSNSLVHAFPKNKSGTIDIQFKAEENDKFKLIVRDNGIGFPKDINLKNPDSLGLQIVSDLVKQLNGRLEVDRKKGTTFTIYF